MENITSKSNQELAQLIVELLSKTAGVAKLFDETLPGQNAGAGIAKCADSAREILKVLTGRIDAAEAALADAVGNDLDRLVALARKDCTDSFKALADLRSGTTPLPSDSLAINLCEHARGLLDLLLQYEKTRTVKPKPVPQDISIINDDVIGIRR